MVAAGGGVGSGWGWGSRDWCWSPMGVSGVGG